MMKKVKVRLCTADLTANDLTYHEVMSFFRNTNSTLPQDISDVSKFEYNTGTYVNGNGFAARNDWTIRTLGKMTMEIKLDQTTPKFADDSIIFGLNMNNYVNTYCVSTHHLTYGTCCPILKSLDPTTNECDLDIVECEVWDDLLRQCRHCKFGKVFSNGLCVDP